MLAGASTSPVRGRTEPALPVRVGLVEDEVFVRSLLERMLAADASLEVVHSLSGVQEAQLAITSNTCDVVLLDVNLPDGNGVALGTRLQRVDPRLAVILLSGQDVMGMFESVQVDAPRPWSYLSKRSSFTQNVLADTVRAAAAGRVVLDPTLVQQSVPRAGTPLSGLSSAQLRVLRLVAEGLCNAAIAQRLSLGERTVESHLQAVYRHLVIDGSDTNRRVAAVLAFMRQTGRLSR